MKNISKLTIANICLCSLSVFLLSWALPQMYSMLFDKKVAKTDVFYSPTMKKMIYTEQVRIDDKQAAEKSENHHADIVYKDEEGNYYTRLEFEERIPFLYFRNMEMRGLLPLEIDEKSYDRAIIEKYRRVLELPASSLDTKRYEYGLYTLLESNPDQVALVLPADRFRFTRNAMEFVDSDENKVHAELTKLFTDALKEKEFAFPAQGVWGNFTIFKPYDAGIFVLDSKGKTYHIIRENDKPLVELVPFKEGIVPAKIIISETKDKLLYGILLDKKDQVYIFHTENYALTHIPSPYYNSDSMDYKILLDPIYLTAIYSDNTNVYAHAFPYTIENKAESVSSIHDFSMQMARTQTPFYAHIAKIIFPFTITLSSESSKLAVFSVNFNGYHSLLSLAFAFLLAYLYRAWCKTKGYFFSCDQGIAIILFGIYMLLTLLILEQYIKRDSSPFNLKEQI